MSKNQIILIYLHGAAPWLFFFKSKLQSTTKENVYLLHLIVYVRGTPTLTMENQNLLNVICCFLFTSH